MASTTFIRAASAGRFMGLLAAAFLMGLPYAAADEMDDAYLLLEQGQAQAAYEAAVSLSHEELSDRASELYTLAGRAAFAKTKDVPLLSKRGWAKRGRDAYRKALDLDPDNKDALLALATFAAKAPDKLGGGEAEYTLLRARLVSVAPETATLLDARILAQRNALASLDLYEAVLPSVISPSTLTEYIDVAEKAGERQRSFAFVEEYLVEKTGNAIDQPCIRFLTAQAFAKSPAHSEKALRHFLEFISTGKRYCQRGLVRQNAFKQAIALADSQSNTELMDMLAALRASETLDKAPDLAG